MEYKRLTIRNEKGFATYNCSDEDRKDCELYYNCGECHKSTQVIKRLAELEDKIEQGTLIELPCKLGDTVYYVLDYGSVKGECVCVEEGKIRAFEIRENYNCIWFEVLYEDFVSRHPLWNIGETVFLTREEAEKRLKEVQE